VRELEERDLVVARVDVAAGGREQSLDERRPQDGLFARERFLEADGLGLGILRQQTPGVGLRVAEPDERVLDAAADALELGQAPEHRLARWQPEGNIVEPKPR